MFVVSGLVHLLDLGCECDSGVSLLLSCDFVAKMPIGSSGENQQLMKFDFKAQIPSLGENSFLRGDFISQVEICSSGVQIRSSLGTSCLYLRGEFRVQMRPHLLDANSGVSSYLR